MRPSAKAIRRESIPPRHRTSPASRFEEKENTGTKKENEKEKKEWITRTGQKETLPFPLPADGKSRARNTGKQGPLKLGN